jgi:hypothetical protein
MKVKKKKPIQWFGCYQDSWKGVITAAAFAHPAKFSKGLVERILDHMRNRGWLKWHDVIGDPFAGVRCGGIIAAYHGYGWIGMELEKKFIDLGEANFELHASKWKALGVPMPVCYQGDSRQFDKLVHAVLTSPPYVSGGHHTDVMDAGNKNGRGQKVKAIVTSPPYSGSLDDGGPEKRHPDGYDRTNNWTGYGKGKGQIATLKTGDVAAVVTSQPFLGARSDTTSSGGGINKKGYEGKSPARPSHAKMGERTFQAGQDKERDPDNIEVLEPGNVDVVVSSPPYEQISAGAGGLNHLPAKDASQQSGRKKGASQSADQTYGTTPGQISHTVKGDVDVVLSSPPYADSVSSESHGIDFSKSKPDYPGRVNHPDRNAKHSAAADNMKYGDAPGQIGKLKAVVTSPPWQKNVEGGRRAGKFKGDAVLKSKRGKGASNEAVRAQAARDEGKTLGDSAGQIGQEAGETYWQAMAKVYHACLKSLKPGGVMAIVVKDFVKDKKRMPLCDDTMRLLVWLGFEEVERIHAMLTEKQIHHDLFEGTTTKVTEKKSFFRRLHESKLPANDPRRIDFEEVLIVRKPATPAQLPNS